MPALAPPSRLWRAAACLLLTAGLVACGEGNPEAPLGALRDGIPAQAGRVPGTVTRVGGTDTADVVAKLRAAIIANGGAVATVVDHSAQAAKAGTGFPKVLTVVGGSAATQVPLLRLDQRAGALLPERYLVRQDVEGGAVTVTYDSANYIAAVAGITDAAASTPLATGAADVAYAATGDAPEALPSPLVGVTSAGFLQTVFGSADVPATAGRLTRAAGRVPTSDAGTVDLAAGSATGGPAIRPTTTVLVNIPEAEGPLLQLAPSMAIEFPMRFVIWVDDQNRTQIGHPSPASLAARYGVPPTDPAVVKLTTEADRLARTAAGLLQ
ncbi:MAG: DUF302 domain-containing protein [Pseudonocardia sp.]|nr:DUF302 domain-containing protein [Pseudonocardia sp.]